MVDLQGKVALITGSSRGIGRGCAIEMATCGADIVINYRTHPDEAAEVAEIVRGLGAMPSLLEQILRIEMLSRQWCNRGSISSGK